MEYNPGKIQEEEKKKEEKEFKSDLNSIAKRKYKSQEQETKLRNIKLLYEAQENVANFFDHYSTVAPETKHASF